MEHCGWGFLKVAVYLSVGLKCVEISYHSQTPCSKVILDKLITAGLVKTSHLLWVPKVHYRVHMNP
jgi:hypothetical protein